MADDHESDTRVVNPFETPTIAPRTRAEESTTQFPAEDWEKYRFISFIGHGSMGRVFLAEDLKLKRSVALKFLRSDDPMMADRFLREAQSQAGVDHPNVCKVYEAGEIEGKLYIAMQHIDGETLGLAYQKMTLEEKVGVMRDIAEGVHTAHCNGLIHRDIKPGNIMLERSSEGAWHPYVLDFGLAREIDAKGLTMTGALVGTPRYMAPEQAWSEKGLLDRRADIYSLGATLYEMLSGHTPLEAGSTMAILKKMLEEEPQSIAKRAPSVPRDLQVIVMKCLERDPQRRYDTAHAFAEDLQRFLNGDPVAARPASLAYRLSRKARKHRALVTVIAVALMAVSVLGITSLRGQIEARKRTELARRFGQQVERMDAVLRIGREIPAHDTRRETESVRHMMQNIHVQMASLGPPAYGPGWYAIGRGHLTLNEAQQAQQALQKAWDVGYHEPEVAYNLGLALGQLYQSELEKVEAIRGLEEREKRRHEAQKKFRDPAVQYLKLSRNADALAPEYAEGLIAFYENRFDDALARAESAVTRIPWLYEARILEGDVYASLGNTKRNSGDYEAAETQYAKAQAVYDQAARIGESDVQVYENLVSLQVDRINLALYGHGGDLKQPVQAALQYAQIARQVDPAKASVPASESMIHRMLAEDQFNRGIDPSAEVQSAIQAAEAALKLDSQNARAYANLGTARELLAELEVNSGKDPQKTMNQAVSELRKAADLDPKDSYVYNILCIAQNITGQYENAHGQDPTSSHEGAIAACARAVALSDKNLSALINLASGYAYLAYYQYDRGLNPNENLLKSEKTLLKALQINPRSAYALNNLGSVYIKLGNYQKDHQINPLPAFQKGLDALRKVNEIYPDDAFPYFNSRDACKSMAEFELRSGQNPEAWIERAEEHFRKGIERNAKLPGSYVDQSKVLEIRIRYEIKTRKNPAATLAAARAYLKKTFELDPNKPNAIMMRGVLSMLEAMWAAQNGRNAKVFIDSAAKDMNAGLTENPNSEENKSYMAELRSLQSSVQTQPPSHQATKTSQR